MADPRIPDPRLNVDPSHSDAARVMNQAPYSDPAADPIIANQTVVQPSRGYGGFIAAGVIAVLLVVALVAFSSGPGTDAGTTAVIPEQSDQMVPTPEAAPSAPAAPLESAPAPVAPAPVAPAAPAPAAPAPTAPAPAN